MPSSILNSDDGVISGTAGLKNSGGDDAVLLIQTKGVTAQTVDAGQRTMFPTTIGVGGATPSTSGSGISFPASASASTNANTLDDYEEGTWTGTLGGSVSNPSTPVTATGKYVKIGKQVTLAIVYDNVNTTGGSGNVYISGVPFTGDTKGGGSASSHSFNFSAGQTSLASEINTTLSFVVLVTSGSGAAFAELQYGGGAGRFLNVGVTYFTA